MSTAKAIEVMREANRIIEDFSVGKFALYTSLFLIEIGLCYAVFKLI